MNLANNARCKLTLSVCGDARRFWSACPEMYGLTDTRLSQLAEEVITAAIAKAITPQVLSVYDVTIRREPGYWPGAGMRVYVHVADWTAVHPEHGDVVGISQPERLDDTPQEIADAFACAMLDAARPIQLRRWDEMATVLVSELRWKLYEAINDANGPDTVAGDLAKVVRKLLQEALDKVPN
jgi:hypothetical protein